MTDVAEVRASIRYGDTQRRATRGARAPGRGEMDLFVFVTFASFCGALAVASVVWRGLLGSPVRRRPILFRGLALGAAAVALAALGSLVSTGPAGDGPGPSAAGPVWAFYSVLICLISAYALLRGRAREASDPQEG